MLQYALQCVLQCVAVCVAVCVAAKYVSIKDPIKRFHSTVWRVCFAVCGSVLRCVTVRFDVLQFVEEV